MWAGGPGWGVVAGGFKGAGGGGKGGKGKGGWGGGGGWGPKGIPDLQESLVQALSAVADGEPELDEIIKKMQTKITKMVEKYAKDERIGHKGTSSQAKVLVEEFVESTMGVLSGCCYEKPWFNQVNWTNPLLLIVLHTFQSSKIFARTLKPQLVKYIEDGVFKWQEEERVTKAIADVVELSGIQPEFKKKANQHLMKSFDDAHMKAPFGSTTHANPELAVLQDFVKGWMIEFVSRASWDVLEDGLLDSSRESKVSQVTVIFQNLMDPSVAVVPADIVSEIMGGCGAMPPSPWAFIDDAAAEVFQAVEAASQQGSAKRQKKGK